MALEGNLRDFGLADILQLIHYQRKTGVLTLDSDTDGVRMSFVGGNLTAVSSQRRTEAGRLGRMLVKRGYITDADLAKALAERKDPPEKIGKILFLSDRLKLEDLIATVQAQMTDTIAQLFSWRDGHYAFVAQDVVVDPDVGVSIDTEHLLMEGLRVTDEWTLLRGRLDRDAIYEKVFPAPSEAGELGDNEKTVLSHLDGTKNAAEILDLSGLSHLDTARAMVGLLEKNLIQVKAPPGVAGAEAEGRGLPEGWLGTLLGMGVVALMIGGMLYNAGGFADALRRYRAGAGVEGLRIRIEMHRARAGSYPGSLSDLEGDGAGDLGLGPGYVYRRIDPDGYDLLHVGPDGSAGTPDDIR